MLLRNAATIRDGAAARSLSLVRRRSFADREGRKAPVSGRFDPNSSPVYPAEAQAGAGQIASRIARELAGIQASRRAGDSAAARG